MVSSARTLMILAVAAIMTLGMQAGSSELAAAATAAKKKVVVVKKPVARPHPPVVVKKKATTAPATVVLGTPTASKKALAVPAFGPVRAPVRKAVSFGQAMSPDTRHGFGTVVAHNAQSDPHLEMKP